jgi:ribosomal protein S18 acetylase RimI-like enzyme
MINAIHLSPATPNDIPALDALINSAYRGESSKKGWTTEADLLGGLRTNPAALAAMLAEPDSVILKYVGSEGAIHGCVYLKKEGLSLYLGMLTVDPNLQGSGIGKIMLAAADDYAKSAGCQFIKMTVISVRAELIAWYQRHGYKPSGETVPFPTDPEFGNPKQPLFFIVLKKAIS